MVSKRERMYADIPAGLEDWVANRLVSAHFRILNAFILGHLLNMAMIAMVFYGEVPPIPGLLWIACVSFACTHRYVIGERSRKKTERKAANQIIRALEINTVCLAGLVVTPIVLLFPNETSSLHRVFLAVVGTTLIGCAGYTMRTLPRAALAYIAIIGCGLIIALLKTGSFDALAVAVLLGATGILLGQMALVAHHLFVVRILKERDAHTSAETVRMLLNDYQDHGSDWLFELDLEGQMVSVSPRFAEALATLPEDLNGRSFINLFADTHERGQLRDHLAERRAFRGLALQLGDSADWWSISGRPANGGATATVHFRGVISDISAEKQAEDRVRHMAHYDSLTGLPNRSMFIGAMQRAMTTSDAKTRGMLMLIDIDNFKNVNDVYGHPIGDAFLKEVGDRIAACAKDNHLGGEAHLVARLGGDEFAVLMGGEGIIDHGLRFVEKLVEALALPHVVHGHEIHSSASVGVAMAPDHGDSAHTLQNNADIALYVAKDNGRNRWEMFEPGMDVAVQQRHAIERDLRCALLNDELRLYFQPLVNVETGKHTGFEALIRWDHPTRGLVMPDDFISIAEETGLIVPIGEWVIRTAMAEAASWQDPHTIAVNLSPVQMRSANLLPTILNALGETGIDPSRFEIEITESVLLNNCEANIAILNRLHGLGIKIALDDFGTGYASLNYLRTFPFDKIKIDRSFVTDLESRKDCRAIVSAVINLANELGMCTLAEGVECEAQLAALRSQGCSMVQGWLFGKAMPAEHYAGLRRINAPDSVQVAVDPVDEIRLRA
jgi:diguanylate cyclase (GGDEF)-like protein